MTRFLLAGTRAHSADELGLGAAAHRVVEATTWYGWLRRWGLLLSFGLARDPVAEVRACLVVVASDERAAERLADGWGTVSGYRVAVLALTGEGAR
jgi:hypothetical protein